MFNDRLQTGNLAYWLLFKHTLELVSQQHLLSTYYVQSTVLGTVQGIQKKKKKKVEDMVPAPKELTI